MPDYRTICQIHAAVLAALFAAYLLLPIVPLWVFGQEALPGAVFMTRRASVVFLGIAAMLMLSRNAPRSEARLRGWRVATPARRPSASGGLLLSAALWLC